MTARNTIFDIIDSGLVNKLISINSNVGENMNKYFPSNFSSPGVATSVYTETMSNQMADLDFSEYDTYLASEESLKKEWLLPEEDEAWKDL